MNGFYIDIRGAAFNLPSELEKVSPRFIRFNGIPLSSVNGLLHVILGERPPSRFFEFSKKYEIKWISDLARGSKFKYESLTPKYEAYYARTSKHEKAKSTLVSASKIDPIKSSGFKYALQAVFGREDFRYNFDLFEAACKVIYAKESKQERGESDEDYASRLADESEQREAASKKLEHLKSLEIEYKKAHPDINWQLTDGYLKYFYNRAWMKVSYPFKANLDSPAINGKPRVKYIFHGSLAVPVPQESCNRVYEKLCDSFPCASFGEGGLALVRPFYSISEDSKLGYIEFKRGFLDLNDEGTPVFSRVEK